MSLTIAQDNAVLAAMATFGAAGVLLRADASPALELPAIPGWTITVENTMTIPGRFC